MDAIKSLIRVHTTTSVYYHVLTINSLHISCLYFSNMWINFFKDTRLMSKKTENNHLLKIKTEFN